MKTLKLFILAFFVCTGMQTYAQTTTVSSPDKKISVTVDNAEKLSYSVKFKDRIIVNSSQLGFELKNETNLDGNFTLIKQVMIAGNSLHIS